MSKRIIFGTAGGALVSLPASSFTHTHVIGTTGYGKSRFLAALYCLLLSQGINVTLIDPAGDVSPLILKRLVASGYFDTYRDTLSRFVYLDVPRAHDEKRYLPFNILSGRYDPYTAANIVLEAFKRVWPALQDGTATSIETIVKVGSYVLACNKLPLLPYLEYLLTNQTFQDNMLLSVHDPLIVKWFKDLGLKTVDGRIGDIALTTLKRSYLMSFSPITRYALAQEENILDFNTLLDKNRSVVINLNLVDPDAKRLLGCLFTVQAEMIAKSRGGRKGTYVLMMDEVQNFISQSGTALENMFVETRRADVFVVVAHQHWGQIPEELHAAFSQCGIKTAFQLKLDHARISVEQMGFPIYANWVKQETGDPFSMNGTHKQYYTEQEQRTMNAQRIENLRRQEAYMRFPDGKPFKMQAINVSSDGDMERVREIEEQYLKRYFRTEGEIIDQIEDTLQPFSAKVDRAKVVKRQQPPEPKDEYDFF